MKERLTTLTRKGQITVPVEIRRALGLHEGDKVALVMEKNEVRLKRAESVVARTAGIFKTERPSLSAEEERAEAEKAIAEDVIERMGK